MPLLVLIAAGWLGWLAWKGRIAWPTAAQLSALVLSLAGGAIAARGNAIIGGVMAAGGLLWMIRKPGRGGARPLPPNAPSGSAAPDDAALRDALDLLGLPPGATRADVAEAHRRLIQRTHPDAGGTEALARNINAARDYLLARLPN